MAANFPNLQGMGAPTADGFHFEVPNVSPLSPILLKILNTPGPMATNNVFFVRNIAAYMVQSTSKPEMDAINISLNYISARIGGLSVHCHFFEHNNTLRLGPLRNASERNQIIGGERLMSASFRPTLVPGATSHRPRNRGGLGRFRGIPKPRNSWIIYRQDRHEEVKALHPDLSTAELSRVIADDWAKETPEIKAQYRDEADTERAAHRAAYPGWKSSPRKPHQIRKRIRGGKLDLAARASAPAESPAMMNTTVQHTFTRDGYPLVDANVEIEPLPFGQFVHLTLPETPFSEEDFAALAHQLQASTVLPVDRTFPPGRLNFQQLTPVPDLSWMDEFEHRYSQIDQDIEAEYLETTAQIDAMEIELADLVAEASTEFGSF